MTELKESPFYLRFGVTVISMAVVAMILYLGSAILLPFFFSILLATLLLPITKKLQDWRLPKVPAIFIALLVSLLIIGVIVYFLSSQVGNFLADIPALERRFNELLWSTQSWIQEHWNIGIYTQREYLNETTEKMKTDSPTLLGQTFLTLTEIVSYFIFLPIYTFLLLYHKDMIKRFLIEVFKDDNEEKVREVLYESQQMSQQYITGLLIELCIVFALNTVGFVLLGIKYAIFLALFAALLNIVPYIGMLIANIICIIISLMTSDNAADAIWVPVILGSVQIVDNNILMPLIVGNKVKLNAIAIIIGVLVAGAITGVGGMFLAIPALAVLKLIFERVDHLKPWAILLGDETTQVEEKQNAVKRALKRVQEKHKVKTKVNVKTTP